MRLTFTRTWRPPRLWRNSSRQGQALGGRRFTVHVSSVHRASRRDRSPALDRHCCGFLRLSLSLRPPTDPTRPNASTDQTPTDGTTCGDQLELATPPCHGCTGSTSIVSAFYADQQTSPTGVGNQLTAPPSNPGRFNPPTGDPRRTPCHGVTDRWTQRSVGYEVDYYDLTAEQFILGDYYQIFSQHAARCGPECPRYEGAGPGRAPGPLNFLQPFESIRCDGTFG